MHLLNHFNLANEFRAYFVQKLHKPIEVKTAAARAAPQAAKPSVTIPSWFKFNTIPLPHRAPILVENALACLFSSIQSDLAAK